MAFSFVFLSWVPSISWTPKCYVCQVSYLPNGKRPSQFVPDRKQLQLFTFGCLCIVLTMFSCLCIFLLENRENRSLWVAIRWSIPGCFWIILFLFQWVYNRILFSVWPEKSRLCYGQVHMSPSCKTAKQWIIRSGLWTKLKTGVLYIRCKHLEGPWNTFSRNREMNWTKELIASWIQMAQKF